MGMAFFASSLFLCFYLLHHFTAGYTRYRGEGFSKALYFAILLTHTPLAAVVPPASLVAIYHALKGNFASHVRITRWLLPVWLYVSVTGVLIYWMLYRL